MLKRAHAGVAAGSRQPAEERHGPVHGRVTAVTGTGLKARFPATARPGRIGGTLKVAVADTWLYATIGAVQADGDGLLLEADFLGQVGADWTAGLKRGIADYPMPGQAVLPVDESELAVVLAPGQGHVAVGSVYPTRSVPATVHLDALLSKHFAILGSTGTGKSSTLALLMHRIVDVMPHGHILILDPHNEYTDAFHEDGLHFDADNLSLPYWLMNLEEHVELLVGRDARASDVEADILKRILMAARRTSNPKAARITADTPVPYKLSDLLGELDAAMGRLDKPEKTLPFLRLKTRIEALKNDPRYGFMFSGLLVQDSLADLIARLLRFPAEGRPVSTLDLSGVPSDIVNVVVSVLCRLVFDFAGWARRTGRGRPILLVCEEAHRYAPVERSNDRFSAARKSLERIAKEGRKYGVALGMVSQRPSDLSESLLSQCGTILCMRMNNARDRALVERALPEAAAGLLDSLPALMNQECILSGEGVSAPVRARLADLPPAKRPSSDDPAFWDEWGRPPADTALVADVVRRWRSQERSP